MAGLVEEADEGSQVRLLPAPPQAPPNARPPVEGRRSTAGCASGARLYACAHLAARRGPFLSHLQPENVTGCTLWQAPFPLGQPVRIRPPAARRPPPSACRSSRRGTRCLR